MNKRAKLDKREEQRQIAIWKLENGFSGGVGHNSSTREEVMKTLVEPQKEQWRKVLLGKYLKTFGKNYEGDIIEDTVFDFKSKRALEKLASR